MIKMFLSLIIVAMLVFFTTEAIRTLTKKQQWGLTKQIGYVTLYIAIAVVLLCFIVILF